jgi:hypothetical protein
MTPQFPPYVHSVFARRESLQVVGQIRNACSFTSLANALNTRANALIHTRQNLSAKPAVVPTKHGWHCAGAQSMAITQARLW